MKVSDYIIQFIADLGVRHIFTVAGAGNVHLLDSMRRNNKIEYICNHHEQASAMAMYSYSRVTNNFGACIVTTGPGATNAITGACSAWVDSIPSLIISGQVKESDTIRNTGVRQFGIQEINIVEMVTPVTKYAAMVRDPQMIRFELEKAVYYAREGRPGPVWLDIPLNIQAANVEPEELVEFRIPSVSKDEKRNLLKRQVAETLKLLSDAERPVMLVGHGVRLANALSEFAMLIDRLQIPILTTWNAIDIMPTNYELYVGRSGIYGQRGANFAIQNSDFLLSIGSRLSIPQVGYDYSQFARAAKKVYVDIDPHELNKFPLAPDIAIEADAKDFIAEMLRASNSGCTKRNIKSWKIRCSEWREKYPVDLPEYSLNNRPVNIFHFISVLADDEIIIPTASGSGFTSSHQALKIKKGQRCFTSNGFAEMGFDIPGAIGACIGANRKRVVTVTGDGGVQMNIQELQTIIHHRLPIKLFILNNNGYLTIRHTENALFKGMQSGTDPETGVSIPNFQSLGQAYGFKTYKITEHNHMRETIRAVLDEPGPVICELIMDPIQPLVPKTSFKQLPDGKLISPPIEDLYPFLDREEFANNMIVPIINSD